MQDAVVNFSRIKMRDYYETGKAPERVGSATSWTAPGDIYKCAPGGNDDYAFIYCHPTLNHMWKSLLNLIGRQDLIDHPEWSNPVWRGENKTPVKRLIEEWTSKFTKHEVMRTLGEGGIPCGAVFNAEDIHSDSHLRERGMIMTMHHPQRGSFDMPGFPVQLGDSPIEMKPAPLLGEHNAEVYKEVLGMNDNDILELEKDGVI